MGYHPEVTTITNVLTILQALVCVGERHACVFKMGSPYALFSNILFKYNVTCSFSTSGNTFPHHCVLMAAWYAIVILDHFTIVKGYTVLP